MDHSRITCRVTDKACRYKQARDEDCPFFSVEHWICLSTSSVARCGHKSESPQWQHQSYCTDWSLFSLAEPFFSLIYPPCKQFDGWLSPTPTLSFLWSETWLRCVAVGSAEEILRWIKQGRECQHESGYKLLYYRGICSAKGAMCQTCAAPLRFWELQCMDGLNFSRYYQQSVCVWTCFCYTMGTIFHKMVALWGLNMHRRDQCPVPTGTDANFGLGVRFMTKVWIELRLVLGSGTREVNFRV